MGLPFVPPEQRPIFGVYWEVRGTLPCVFAALPFPPLSQSIPVYAIGDPVFGGQFLVDEMVGSLNANDAAPAVEAQLAELQSFVVQIQGSLAGTQLSVGAASGAMGGAGPGGGGTGGKPLDYTTNDLWLQIISVTNATGFFVVHAPQVEATSGVYDLFMATNVSRAVPGLNPTNWTWLVRTAPGQTSLSVEGLLTAEAFFILGRTNDLDADGLSDAFEHLVSHSDPTKWSTRGDGISDLIAYLEGRNPTVPGSSPDNAGMVNLQVYTPLR
jgi:hypothetical protein